MGTSMAFFNMNQGDAPVLKKLAQEFSISDNYHQAVMGGTGAQHIMIGTGDDMVNAKSMTNLMMLGAAQGSKLKLRCEGPDAREALKAVQTLFDDRFGEE